MMNCSIMMNLAYWLKLCPVWLKCLSTGIALGSLTSFLWLFNHILKAASAFPTYWILQSSYSSKYMMTLLLQVVFWNVLNVLFVWLLRFYYLFTTKCPRIWKAWWTFSVGKFVNCKQLFFFFLCVCSNQLSQFLAFAES